MSEAPAMAPPAVLRDLRALEPADLLAAARAAGADRLLVTAWQAARLRASDAGLAGSIGAVTLPDFLNYARLINTGQARTMLELNGSLAGAVWPGISAALGLVPMPLRAARQDFWAVALALTRFDAALVPGGLDAAVLLHPYLADFAFTFGRRDLMRAFFALAGERAGIHTQQLPMAAHCLASWGLKPRVLSYLCAPGHEETARTIAAMRRGGAFGGTRFQAECAFLPPDLQDPAGISAILPAPAESVVLAPR